MKKYSEKHPVMSVIILFVIGVILGGIVAGFLNAGGFDSAISGSIVRILLGIVFLVFSLRKIRLANSFKGFVIMLPALLFAAYKIPYHFVSGGGTVNMITLPIILIGLAPAVFEEVLFRGILIFNLKKKYSNPITIVFISALVFSLIHLTNIIGMDVISLSIQLIMAFVVGVVLGAVYLKTGDIVSVIIAHFLIDVTSGIFPGGGFTPYYFLGIIIALWIVETVYGFMLVRKETV